MTNETQQVKISAGHTPGPWYTSAVWSFAHDKAHYAIMRDRAAGFEPLVIASVGGFVTDDESIAANARLIAAAPDLLEALVVALDALYDYGDSSVTGTIESAIRKARGEAAS